MTKLLAAIVNDDAPAVRAMLKADPGVATSLIPKPKLYRSKIFHWIYAGDTALHLAAAGYRTEVVRLLLGAGADVDAAHNHRKSTPLHYAADGFITGPVWDERRQVATVTCLLENGAAIHAQDMNGATPLHRAVRTRSAAIVKMLLQKGANPAILNKPGSTPFHLAVQNTGRGGSGADEAIDAQREIIGTFLSAGVDVNLKDQSGKSVLEWARSAWVRDMLVESHRH